MVKTTEYYIVKQKFLKKSIEILCIIASLDISPKFFFILKNYGINFTENIGVIYNDSIYNTMQYESSFNTEAFIFLAVVCAGIYAYEYTIKSVCVVTPLALSVMAQLSSGSRGSLVSVIILFSSQFIINKKNSKEKVGMKNKKKIIIPVALMILIFLLITYFRSESEYELPYASSFLSKVSSKSKMPYSVTFYFSSPIAVFNEYIKQPRFSMHFGGATFRIFYLFLNSLGIINYNTNFISEYLY